MYCAFLIVYLMICSLGISITHAANPLVGGVGMADPHVHVFEGFSGMDDGPFYMYATHDYALNNTDFRMDNWWVWSSADLLTWTQRSLLKPEQTALRKKFTECWATDAALRRGNGKDTNQSYFFYLSLGPTEIGVVTGPSPVGPWQDPLGKPLIPEGLVPTQARDPGVLQDDDGNSYIIFGTFDYFIARLGEDLISLAEVPRPVDVHPKFGPYGKGKLDDKPFLHKRSGVYYLSWGCYYGTSSQSPYGPFLYQGSVIEPAYLQDGFNASDYDHDRHGSFFTRGNQWFYVANDRTHGATPYFRNVVAGYVMYFDNGTIRPVNITATGVGEYDVSGGGGAGPAIEGEYFFSCDQTCTARECRAAQGGFALGGLYNGTNVQYPNVRGIYPGSSNVILSVQGLASTKSNAYLEVCLGSSALVCCQTQVPAPTVPLSFSLIDCPFSQPLPTTRTNITLRVFASSEAEEVALLDFFYFN